MPTFTFRAYDSENVRVYGARKADSEDTVQKYAEGKGYTSVSVFKSETAYRAGIYKLASPKELSIFCRQMSVLFFSQITLMEGVVLLSEQTENKNLKTALLEIHALMEQGYTLSESMGMYPHIFGAYLLNMVSIGETSGTLDIVFGDMSDYFDKESKLRKKLASAVTYPAILSVMMGAIVLLLILKILPMFGDILRSMGGEMPAVTKAMISISGFIVAYLPVIVAVIVLIVIAITAYSRTEKGAIWFDKMKLNAPIAKFINRRVITSRFARSMAILLKSGVQLVNALEETKAIIDNKYLEKTFNEIINKVKEGMDLDAALKELGIFPPLFLKMVFIGQTTGHIDNMLDKSAVMFDEDVDEALEKMTVMLEPILIIVLSIVVGIILVSVMLPMISIMNAIG